MRAPRLSLATMAVTFVVAYLVFAVFAGALGIGTCYLLVAACAVLVGVGLRVLRWRGALSDFAPVAIALCAFSILISLVAVDTFFGLRHQREETAAVVSELREPTLRNLQLRPRRFYPTPKNFTIYKPDVRLAGWTYGDLTPVRFRRSPTLMSSVLEHRRVVISIDGHGFRETTSLADATVLALGDSYVQAPSLSQELTWPKVLESISGEPVYNLGVDEASPAQELWLLDHVLTTLRPRSARRVIWMIFEGNDLEDSYRPWPVPAPRLFKETLIGALAVGVPEAIHDGSVVKQLLSGGFRRRGADPDWTVDGLNLPWPLWTSSRFGRAFAFLPYVERAGQSASYVERHVNRGGVEAVFAEMKTLAAAHRLAVTVVLAPTFPRLYAAEFGHAEAVSREPHFLRFVERLAKGAGFAVVDLAELMRPYAAREMLYFRDDSHWNARGNRVAAELIAHHAFGR